MTGEIQASLPEGSKHKTFDPNAGVTPVPTEEPTESPTDEPETNPEPQPTPNKPESSRAFRMLALSLPVALVAPLLA